MKVLVLVPARGGSKRLPKKNLRHVGGISLVGRAVHAGRQFVRRVALAESMVLVDTDSAEVAVEAERWGAVVPFLRPPHLATDQTATIENVLHVIERLRGTWGEADAIVLLQPTSPLRTAEDIAGSWDLFHPVTAPSVVSVTPLSHSAEHSVRLSGSGLLETAPSSEVGPRAEGGYVINGAVYIATTHCLRKFRRFVIPGLSCGAVMPPERSIDVDSASDLDIAEALARSLVPREFSVAGRMIGSRAPCFVIAEGGVNHNGDVSLAHRLIDIAAAAGADAVKFQTFDPDRLVAPEAPKAHYQKLRTDATESQHAMLRRLVLPLPAHAELQRHAAERGIMFLSTAFDEQSADFLDQLGLPAFKIPSGELTNHAFLAHVARKRKPLLISTGMGTLEEVAGAVEVVRAAGDAPFALLHCVTSYPAPPEDCNLRAMLAMQTAFNVPVGWSDHTLGVVISVAAAAFGACVIEKHFTVDRTLPGPDHRASLEPRELTELIRSVRAMEAAKGDGIKRPMGTEVEHALVVRRSLHVAQDLPAGHVLEHRDLVALRPGTGIPPSREASVLGRALRVAMRAGDIIQESDLV